MNANIGTRKQLTILLFVTIATGLFGVKPTPRAFQTRYRLKTRPAKMPWSSSLGRSAAASQFQIGRTVL